MCDSNCDSKVTVNICCHTSNGRNPSFMFSNRLFEYAIEALCNSVEALWNSIEAVYRSDGIGSKSWQYFLKSCRYFEKYRQDFIAISCTFIINTQRNGDEIKYFVTISSAISSPLICLLSTHYSEGDEMTKISANIMVEGITLCYTPLSCDRAWLVLFSTSVRLRFCCHWYIVILWLCGGALL